jgi:uncharacterized protein YndB with AHSA1/START domain
MDTLAVKRDIWINASRERVWHAVTDPRELGQWWTPDEWKISALQVGGRLQFGLDDDAAYATIAVVDPPREFTLRWDGNEKFPAATMTTTLQLEEENGGTRLRVTEAGFEGLPEDIRQKRFDQTGEGYTAVLNDLKSLLESESVQEGK